MKKFILLCFIFLAAGFYEASGGAGFDPEAARLAAVEARQDRDALRRAARPAPILAQAPFSAPENAIRAEPPSPAGDPPEPALKLVSFAAVTTEVAAPVEVPAPPVSAPLSDVVDAALASDTPLSLSSLEPAEPQNANAFAGSRTVATSQNAGGAPDIRAVKGTLVNLRSGPGTEYDVIDQLSQNTTVEVLTDAGNGWVELRPIEGGTSGWIAAFLLTRG